MKGMYVSNRKRDHQEFERVRSSRIWKGVVCGSELLCRGLTWKVKNGKKIKFWAAHWIEDYPLGTLCTRQVQEKELQMRVEEFWKEQSGWKWSVVGNCLLHTSLLKLTSITLDTSGNEVDMKGWLEPHGVIFSVSLAYELAVGRSEEGKLECWSLIWPLKVQQ